MRLFRSSFSAVLASSLSVMSLAGCPNAGTGPAIPVAGQSGAPSAATTDGTAASGANDGGSSTPGGSNGSTSTPAPGASGSPSAVVGNPAPSGARTVVSGDVFDEDGATVDGATVKVNSLDARVPYTATLQTVSGHYVTNDVPVGVQIQVIVSKANWTTRTRVESFQPNTTNVNTVNFGASAEGSGDPNGAPFFISDYPEVSGAIPGESTSGAKVVYVVRFSEPFDQANRNRIENAFTLTGQNGASITKSSTFLGTREKVKFAWNDTNDQVTVTFNAPLQADDNDDTSYSFSLTRAAGAELIVDNDDNVLGLTGADEGGSQYREAIKLAGLKLTGTEATGQARWESTHTRASDFDVKEDNVRPKLVSVDGSDITLDGTAYLRLELTFSEPMVAYPMDSAFSAGALDLGNYAFAITKDTNLNGTDMEDAPSQINNASTLADMEDLMDSETPFQVSGSDFPTPHFSETDAKVIQIEIPKDIVPTDATRLRVLVDPAVEDPAGNKVSESGDTSEGLADNIQEGAI